MDWLRGGARAHGRFCLIVWLPLRLRLVELLREVFVNFGPRVVLGEGRLRGEDELVEPLVEDVQLGGVVAADVEPPITSEGYLGEDGAVRAQKRRLAPVQITVVPDL